MVQHGREDQAPPENNTSKTKILLLILATSTKTFFLPANKEQDEVSAVIACTHGEHGGTRRWEQHSHLVHSSP